MTLPSQGLLRILTTGMLTLLLALAATLPMLAAPQFDPEAPANQTASIPYEIYQLPTGRTPASNLYCDTGGAVFYGAETKGVAPGYLGHIDPTGRLTEWAYGWAPINMVKDNKGRMWTADFEGAEIARLHPASGQLTSWETGYTHLHGLGIYGGIIWTTSRDGFVLRFRPATGELRVFALPGGVQLKHSLVDRQGRLWIATGDQAGAGAAVFMFEGTTRKFTRYQLPTGFNPWAIREAADGALWFSNFNLKSQTTSPYAVARLSPATSQWTSFGGYSHPSRNTDLDWLGDQIIGVNILGDEFFLLDPAAAGETMTLTKTETQGVLRETKILTPQSQTLTPIVSTLSPTTAISTGAASASYTIFPIPNPYKIHSLFGVSVCGNHVWMSGLLADQIYHFVAATSPTPTPTAARTATSTPTPARTPTPTPVSSATFTPTRFPTTTATPTLAPTATATPNRPVAIELSPAADAYLNLWNPDTNYGGSTIVALRPGFISSLLRFDLSALPANAAITQAELAVYVIGRTNEQAQTAAAYRMLRAWDEFQATANIAKTGQPWSAPMANGAGDHEAAALSSAALPATGWATLDVTAAALAWMNAGPGGNFGLLLQASSADLVQYSLASREAWPADQRPKLIIRYTLPSSANEAIPAP